MKKKSVPVYTKANPASINLTTGLIQEVVILQKGTDKVGDNFDLKSLKQLIALGNAQEQGVKSRFGHPNACNDALGTYIGRYKNFQLSKNEDGKAIVVADLYLDPIAKNSPGKGDLFSYVLGMASTNADMFGNSIVYTRAEPEIKIEVDAEGNEVPVPYERFDSFIASDVVDSPAATTNLFKDTSNNFAAVATDFLEENPELFEYLYKNESIVGDFLRRYNTYKQTQEHLNMKKDNRTFTERLKSAVLSVVNEFSKSEDGADKAVIVAVLQSGEQVNVEDLNGDGVPSIGDIVTSADGVPMASTELIMEDGSHVYTDANGAIIEVQPAEVPAMPTPEPTTPAPAPVMQSEEVKSLQSTVAMLNATIEKMKADYEAEQEAALVELEKLKNTLSKIKSEGNVPVGTQNFKANTKVTNDNVVAQARERMVAERAAKFAKN